MGVDPADTQNDTMLKDDQKKRRGTIASQRIEPVRWRRRIETGQSQEEKSRGKKKRDESWPDYVVAVVSAPSSSFLMFTQYIHQSMRCVCLLLFFLRWSLFSAFLSQSQMKQNFPFHVLAAGSLSGSRVWILHLLFRAFRAPLIIYQIINSRPIMTMSS